MKKIAVIDVIICSLSLILLSACSSRYASNAETQYLKSRNGNALVVPPPMTNTNISHFYDLTQGRENVMVSIIPPI